MTKQYNLCIAKDGDVFLTGKVTAGLAESNGSLPQRDDFKVTYELTACTLESAPCPTLGNEYVITLPFYSSNNQNTRVWISQNKPT